MSLRQTMSISALFAVTLHLAGCDRPATSSREAGPAVNEAAAPVVPQSAPLAHPTPAAPTPAPAAAPPSPPAPPAPPAGIAQPSPDLVLREWGSAIEARDWARVRRLWGHNGADSGLGAAAFAARWDKLRAPRVTVGPGQQEGAAGSLYYTAPVTITDRSRTISGEVTLRRVNDVPGASAEQLRWHFDPTVRAPWTTLG